MQLSESSQKILRVFFAEPKREFFINELARLTKLFPNSVFRSLQTLEKQGILKSKKAVKFKYFYLNFDFRNIREVEKIVNLKDSLSLFPITEWVKILNRQSSISFTMALCKSNVSNLKQVYGITVPNHWTNGITFGVYYLKDELTNLGKAVSKRAEEDSAFFGKDVKQCRDACDELVAIAKEIPDELSQYTDEELAGMLERYYQGYLSIFPFVTVPHGIERYFETKIREMVQDQEILKVLLSPVSTQDIERDDALNVASYVRRNGFDKKYGQLLGEHTRKYCWLSMWSIDSEPLGREYFESEIINILGKVNDPEGEIKRMKDEGKKAKELLAMTLKEIRASNKLEKLVNYLQEYIYLRTYRKNSICQAHYYHLPLLSELAKRLKLSLDEIKLMSCEEMISGIKGEIDTNEIKSLVGARSGGWAVCMWQGEAKIITGVKDIIETMERFNIVAASSSMQRTVKGNVASGGIASGRVKVIRKLSEIDKIKEGDVLVTRMTTPDYVVAMRKAVAIVTDEGGITCHAAIVSREFGIPCIVGTKNATQILNDNDWVEVDAQNGVVKISENMVSYDDVRTVSGRTIYKGKVRGRVRVVLDASDFNKIQNGDILVTAQTTPEYLSLLYRVGGYVVDEDSLTSHAVLYGKALKIPSIMGTTYARNVLKDGEEIELDADSGVITRLD